MRSQHNPVAGVGCTSLLIDSRAIGFFSIEPNTTIFQSR